MSKKYASFLIKRLSAQIELAIDNLSQRLNKNIDQIAGLLEYRSRFEQLLSNIFNLLFKISYPDILREKKIINILLSRLEVIIIEPQPDRDYNFSILFILKFFIEIITISKKSSFQITLYPDYLETLKSLLLRLIEYNNEDVVICAWQLLKEIGTPVEMIIGQLNQYLTSIKADPEQISWSSSLLVAGLKMPYVPEKIKEEIIE